jgi:hypothetical protein
MNFETKLNIVHHIFNSSIEYDTPLTVKQNETVGFALDLINKKNH